MSYGPPQEPNASPAPPYPHQHQPGANQQPQPWTDPHGRSWPGGPPPAARPKGAGLAVASVLFGLVACGVWMLPINLDRIRAYSPLPFALLGITLAVLACIGPRRGKPLAAVGWVLNSIALLLSLTMIIQTVTN